MKPIARTREVRALELEYSPIVKLLPRERLVIESPLEPAAVLAALPRAVDETNRRAFLLGIRCELDEERVRVGYWPRVAFSRAGIAFEGGVAIRDGRTVVTGEVRFFPRWYEVSCGAVLFFVAVLSLIEGIRDGRPWAGVLGAAWLAGGGRLAMEIMFRVYRKRIARALGVAAGALDPPSMGAAR